MGKLIDDNLIKVDNKIIWAKNIGKSVVVLYNNNEYSFIIKSLDKNQENIVVSYNNEDYVIRRTSFKHGRIYNIVSKDFLFKVNEIINDNIILTQEKINGSKYYKVKCIRCGYIRTISEYELKKKHCCGVCANKIIIKGINDIATTHPHLIKYFKYKDDAYKYSYGSGQKVWLKCHDCGFEKYTTIVSMSKYQLFNCPRCSDGFSYPEKLIISILDELNIDYIAQYKIVNKSFKFKNKDYKPIYDIYFENENKKYLIEMDGGFHKKAYRDSKLSTKDVKFIDKQKDILAKENDYQIIRIDSQKSNFNYIMENIKKSILANMFDFSLIDETTINSKIFSSLVKQVCDYYNSNKNLSTSKIATYYKLDRTTIVKYLKIGKELGWCDYTSQESYIKNAKLKEKQIICLNTKKIYNSIQSVAEDYSINIRSVSNCCHHRIKHAGFIIKDGKKEMLCWMFLSEYEEKFKTDDDIKEYIKNQNSRKEIKRMNTNRKVICLNNKHVFKNLLEAQNSVKLKSMSGLSQCCNGLANSAGTDSETGEPLKWIYYEDYIKKMEEL